MTTNSNRRNPRLPANCPALLQLAVYRRKHREQTQWQGKFRFYQNGKPSDLMTVVVNPTRFARPSQDGEEWWVEPIGMAPHARVLFATARYPVGSGPEQTARAEKRVSALRAPRYGDSLEELEDLHELLRLEEFYNSERPDYD